MKKFDLINRPYSDIYDLMNHFFDGNLPLSKAFSGIKIDVQEKENSYLVEADLPGVNKEDIHLDLVDHYLLIEVEQKSEQANSNNSYVRRERFYSSLKRSVYLAHAQKEGIEAKMENGVLIINVPKQSQQNPKQRIEIK